MYQQLVEQIKRRVATGDWQAGQEIPSIRSLAAAVQVSVITVKRAYLELEREGVIVTRQGRGSFVADTPGLDNALQERELDGHLTAAAGIADDLNLSQPDLEKRLATIRTRMKRQQQ